MGDDLILELLEHFKHRFFGKYRGVVTEVESAGRGRIKASVPAVLGEQTTGWCDPCVPYAGNGTGFAFLPEVGSGVWIEFEGGDVSFPIWVGCYWRDGEIPPDAAAGTKVIRTASGHQLKLDDDGSSIELTDANGGSLKLDASGITVTRGAASVALDDAKVSLNDGALEVT